MGLPAPLPVDLSEPGGGAERAHDPTFGAWDRGFDALRDTINLGIRAINEVGAGLRELPHDSLEDLLVVPLSGDYATIRANAVACHQVEDALAGYAAGCTALSLAAAIRWRGRAALAYLVRLDAHALAARGIGRLVGEGAVVFDEVADFCEDLAVRVEELVVELGETMGRLARKLLSRVAGPAGWATFAAELAFKGLDAVTDIVDDVQRVLAIIDTLQELQDTVRDWAEEQRARLDLLLDLPGMLPVAA
jgi:hypothetical protein